MEHTKAYLEYKKNGNTKFVRYSEGAEMYHMSVSKFMQMAKDAKAIYKLGQLVLVNLKIFDEENISYHVAAGHIDEELLTELMTAILDNTYDNDEALKLKLFNAISIEEQFYE